MENANTMNDTIFVLNTTSTVGHNDSLPYPFPASTIVTVTVSSFGILANVLVIFTILFSSLRTSVIMNLILSLAIFDYPESSNRTVWAVVHQPISTTLSSQYCFSL